MSCDTCFTRDLKGLEDVTDAGEGLTATGLQSSDAVILLCLFLSPVTLLRFP